MSIYQRSSIELIFIRHGGGAHFGKTHVFNTGWNMNISMQCVTDDFGTLVEV